MPIKVQKEEIAWMEEFGLLDQPVIARGANVFTMRAVLYIAIGVFLLWKGINAPGNKIGGIISPLGIILIIPGVLFVLFGIIPTKSVRREIQFLFAIQLLLKKIFKNSNKTKKKKVKKTKTKQKKKKKEKVTGTKIDKNVKKRTKVEKKKVIQNKKKIKPIRLDEQK